MPSKATRTPTSHAKTRLTTLAVTLAAGVIAPGSALPAASVASPLPGPLAPRAIPSPTGVLARTAGATGPVSFPAPAGGAPESGQDRSLAPYLYVAGGDPATDRLPLKETSAEVSIAGVIARVRTTQVFGNAAARPIEAVYVFPASTRAAVHGMRMRIGSRVVEARIDRRREARQSYEAARREGRRASLLEQERANVFSMSVANIVPGDRIVVELDYSEMLVPEDAVYEFVYPTVVGPRYAGGADPARDNWMASPHLPAGQPEPYGFDLKLHVEAGMPIRDVASPSHPIAVAFAHPTRADVKLDRSGATGATGGGNRDFVLRYRLAGDRIQTGLLLWEGARTRAGESGENFFALLMEPPRQPADSMIPPREYVFLLDVSGSMHGFPLDTARTLMRDLLSRLRPTDHFNLALFSGASFVMRPEGSLPATAGNIARGIALVEQQRGGGGTELMGGLEASYRIPPVGRGVSRTVVVVTDGYVGVEARAFRFIRERLGEANLFAFGIGSSVNRGLIEGMARAGMGEPFVVLGPTHAAAEAEKLRRIIERPVLTDIGVRFDGFAAEEVAPARVPDLLARRPLVLFGKYRGPASGRIVVSGVTGAGRFLSTVEVAAARPQAANAALRWLWARKWVATLDDEHHMGGGQPVEDAITGLGLGYNLLTAFTSFVAVDSEIANRDGAFQEMIRQPLPMPEGVSNFALGGIALRSRGKAALAPGAYGALGRGAGAGGIAALVAPAAAPAVPAEKAADAVGRRSAAPVRPDEDEKSERASLRDREVDRLAGGKPGKEPAKTDRSAEPTASGATASRLASPRILVMSASSLDDTRALVAAVEAALAGSTACLGARRSTLVLRLTIDATGRVTSVKLAHGDRAPLACLRRLLVGLASATRATGATTGTVDLALPR